jgi:hypothetical protein
VQVVEGRLRDIDRRWRCRHQLDRTTTMQSR